MSVQGRNSVLQISLTVQKKEFPDHSKFPHLLPICVPVCPATYWHALALSIDLNPNLPAQTSCGTLFTTLPEEKLCSLPALRHNPPAQGVSHILLFN
jgi:hypothetical protein